jgi:hypothetical protein
MSANALTILKLVLLIYHTLALTNYMDDTDLATFVTVSHVGLRPNIPRGRHGGRPQEGRLGAAVEGSRPSGQRAKGLFEDRASRLDLSP